MAWSPNVLFVGTVGLAAVKLLLWTASSFDEYWAGRAEDGGLVDNALTSYDVGAPLIDGTSDRRVL